MSAANADTTSSSTPTFVAALVTAAVTFTAYTLVFVVLHAKFQNVFQPRTLLAPEAKRPRVLPTSIIGWFKGVITEPDIRAGEMNGPDAYFFIRFLKVLVILLFPLWIISWPVLMTVAAVKPNAGLTGLNQFSYGNVRVQDNSRHIAHLVCAIVFIFWTLFLLFREYRHFHRVRQAYLNSPAHASLARSRTVMLNNVPKNMLSEERIREMGAATQGTVEQVWLPRKVKDMEKIFDNRNKECQKLEAGETKAQVLAAKNAKKNELPTAADSKRSDILSRYVLDKKRPTHKLGLLGLLGKKVDTLDYSPQYIREQEELLALERAKLADCQLMNSAFVRFTKQTDAHTFARTIKQCSGSKLIGAAIEVVPEDIIWTNLGMSPIMRKIRTFISWAITITLIIFWGVLVVFVTAISQIQAVCSRLSFLNWICKLPTAVVGIIQGILPPVAVSILFMLLPIFLRFLIKFEGAPRHSDLERKLFSRFWLFQVIDGFLIAVVGSGVTASLGNAAALANNLPQTLATNLPLSSIFFLTLVLVNTFTKSASTVSRLVPVVKSKLAFILRGKTPRKAYQYDYKMDSISLALTWPPIALLACIAIVYSVIQPIVTGFAFVGMCLLYLTYKYFMIWVVDQPDMLETGGLYYPKALRTIFVSLYIMELAMTGLFFLLESPSGGRATVGLIAGPIMIAMIVITVACQCFLEYKFYHKRIFLDSSAFPSAGSAEQLWPHSPRDAETVQPGTLNLNTDLVAQHAAQHGEGPHYGNTTGLHKHAFDHPATWKALPIVWVADDALGIGKAEVARINSEKVPASVDYAFRDPDGKVSVERGPPDEAWYGGKTAA